MDSFFLPSLHTHPLRLSTTLEHRGPQCFEKGAPVAPSLMLLLALPGPGVLTPSPFGLEPELCPGRVTAALTAEPGCHLSLRSLTRLPQRPARREPPGTMCSAVTEPVCHRLSQWGHVGQDRPPRGLGPAEFTVGPVCQPPVVKWCGTGPRKRKGSSRFRATGRVCYLKPSSLKSTHL